MIGNNKRNKSLKLATAFGLAIASSSGITGAAGIDEDAVLGVWGSDELGRIEIDHCHYDKNKYCGYLLEIKDSLSKRFNITVDAYNRDNNLVISDLGLNSNNNTYTGRITNVDSFLASIAAVEIEYGGGNTANVSISIPFISLNYKFEKIKPSKPAPTAPKM